MIVIQNTDLQQKMSILYFTLFYLLVAVYDVYGGTEIREPRVQQKGDTTIVSWDVTDSTQGLCCYQVDVRSDGDPNWRPHGSEVPQVPNQQTYTTELRNLHGNTRYYVHVRCLSSSRGTTCTSPSASFESPCVAPQSPPDNIEIRSLDSRTIVLSWNHPHQSTRDCTEIWYNVEGFGNNQPQRFEVRGDLRSGYRIEHRIPTEPGAQWRLRVQTVNSGGVSRWSEEHTVETNTEAYVSAPTLTSQGPQIRADWHSQGQGASAVYGYYIEYKTSQDPRWQSQRSLIPYRGDGISYSGVLSNVPVGGTVYVRIQVIDRNQRPIFTSPEAYIDITCSAPTQPPANVQIYAPDSRHVRITWDASAADVSLCPGLTYEIQVLEPANMPVVRLPDSQASHSFEARPSQRWMIQVRAVNSAGESPWSSVRTVTTSPPQELIIGPTVSYQPTVLTWRSIENVDELVQAYRVEIQLDYDPTWRPHSSGMIRYIGHQRPYNVHLNDLPEGRTVEARVVVIDPNNNVAYESSAVPINVPKSCRPPLAPPSSLRAQSVGSNQISVTFTPLSPSEWNCDRVWYNLKFTADHTQGSKKLTSDENSAFFDTEPGSRWSFQIQAVTPSGASPWSPEERIQTDLGVPGKVGNVRVNPVSPDTLQITWDPPYNTRGRIDTYEIVYQLLSKGMCGESPERENIVTFREPSYTLQGLHPHSRYRISIKARTNVAGEAVTEEVTTPVSAPSAPPRNVQVQNVQAQQFTVVWQAPPCLQTNGEIREYEYEVTGMDPWATIERYVSRVPDTRIRLDRLTPYTKYRIKVRAWTSQGSGPWSPEIFASTGSSDEPAPPTVLRAIDAQPNSIQLWWQAQYPSHTDIDRYNVQFSLSGRGSWQEREFRLSDLSCSPEVQRSQRVQYSGSSSSVASYCTVISGLDPDQKYDFQVASHAVNGRRYGAWSNTESARTGAGPVQIVNIQQLKSSDNSLDISWFVRPSDQSRVRGFMITVNPIRGHGRRQEYNVDGPVYQYHIDGLSPNTQYNVSVQARTDRGLHEGMSRVMNTEDSRIPSIEFAPSIIQKLANSVTVQWTAPRDADSITGYIVEFTLPSRGDWSQRGPVIRHVPGKTSYQHVVDGLAPNSDVVVRIRAVGRNDIRGDPSSETSARTECMPPSLPPQAVQVEPICSDGQDQRIAVTWQVAPLVQAKVERLKPMKGNSTNITGGYDIHELPKKVFDKRPVDTTWRCDQVTYEIAYTTDKQPLEQTVRVPSGQSEHSFPAAPFTKWTVRIRSVNRVGESKWSQAVEAVTCEGIYNTLAFKSFP